MGMLPWSWREEDCSVSGFGAVNILRIIWANILIAQRGKPRPGGTVTCPRLHMSSIRRQGEDQEFGRFRSSTTAMWFEQPLESPDTFHWGHTTPTLGPSVALSRSCAGDALTSQVPPANGHKALKEHFAGVLTGCSHAMQPDEQHPVAMLPVALHA